MALNMRVAFSRCRVLSTMHTVRLASTVDSATEVTHTGQVNRQFAEKLIAEVPPVACKDHTVSCDGGGGALGHPKVFINLDQPGSHSCGYCGLRFYLDDKH